jgi:hypothetical protein
MACRLENASLRLFCFICLSSSRLQHVAHPSVVQTALPRNSRSAHPHWACQLTVMKHWLHHSGPETTAVPLGLRVWERCREQDIATGATRQVVHELRLPLVSFLTWKPGPPLQSSGSTSDCGKVGARTTTWRIDWWRAFCMLGLLMLASGTVSQNFLHFL